MEIEKNKAIIEAILYSAGREVKMTELMSALELGANEIANIIESMKSLFVAIFFILCNWISGSMA